MSSFEAITFATCFLFPSRSSHFGIFGFPLAGGLTFYYSVAVMEKMEKKFGKRIKDYFIATRPWSFTMSLISVSVGTLLAAEEGPILWGWYALVGIGIVCFHAAANVYNDYFDTRYQVDQPDSPTARYRPQPILTGMFTPAQVLSEAIVLNGSPF
jgi:heme O synthase-like polyprenyltransferase